MTRIVVFVLSAVAIIATTLPLLREEDWWIRIFDFPRLQIFTVSLILAGAFIFFVKIRNQWQGVLLALLILAAFYQGYRIYPYTFLAAKQVKNGEKGDSGTRFSLMTSNVLMDNRNVEAFLAIVKNADPDILIAMEVDRWWTEQIKQLEERYEYSVKYPMDNKYGMSLYSRLKLINPEVKFLIEDEVPSIHALVEFKSGDIIELHCLHPKPPAPAESKESTKRDAELVMVGKQAKKSAKPVVVAGDLNDVAWSHTTRLFQKIGGLLDPRIGRGMYNTFHADYFWLRFPLDHVFHSDHFTLVRLERLPYFGSDHFPIYIELSYAPQAQAEQKEPVAGPEDRKEAEEKIQKAKQNN